MAAITVFQIDLVDTRVILDDDDDGTLPYRKAGMAALGLALQMRFSDTDPDSKAVIDAINYVIAHPPSGKRNQVQIKFKDGSDTTRIIEDGNTGGVFKAYRVVSDELDRDGNFILRFNSDHGAARSMEVSLPNNADSGTIGYLEHVLKEVGIRTPSDEQMQMLAARLFLSRCT